MPARQSPLFLHEEVLLLALRDERGTIPMRGAMYRYALGGAILSELLLGRRVSVAQGRRKLVNLVSDRPFGEPVLDECLAKVASARRRASAPGWVRRFAELKNLKHRVARGLCERGILRADENTVLFVFRRRIYPEINPQPERRLIQRLRRAIFGESRQVDPRTAILVALAHSADLLPIVFDRKELKRRRRRLKQLREGQLVGKATREAVEAARAAAVVAACITPAIATAAVSS